MYEKLDSWTVENIQEVMGSCPTLNTDVDFLQIPDPSVLLPHKLTNTFKLNTFASIFLWANIMVLERLDYNHEMDVRYLCNS